MKKYVEYNGKMVEAVDCTPQWAGLLPLMLDLHAQLYTKQYQKGFTSEQAESLKGLHDEFKKMAKAADQYNEMVKKQKEN